MYGEKREVPYRRMHLTIFAQGTAAGRVRYYQAAAAYLQRYALMVRLLIVLALCATSLLASAADCRPQLLPTRALKLVKPLLVLRLQQVKDQFTADGRWVAESPVTPRVENLFESLLANRTTAGDEALAYLLNIYLGEHSGEELTCEVTNRGKRMIPLIRAYQQCLPLTGLEPLPKFVQGSGSLPGMALDGIASGNVCQYE